MAARTRQVGWAEAASRALAQVVDDIAATSPDGAAKVLEGAVDAAASLSTLSERGRVVPEVGDPVLRQLLVFDYRLICRVHPDRVVIRAFLHGARDFSKWRRDEGGRLGGLSSDEALLLLLSLRTRFVTRGTGSEHLVQSCRSDARLICNR